MKKISKLTLSLVLVLSIFTLSACGNSKNTNTATDSKEEDNKIVIGVSPTPHAEIIENLQDEFKKEGLDVEVVVFDDYVQPNVQLDSGDLDANFFQHKPYFDSFVEEHNLELDVLGYVHVEPMGVYSKEFKSLDDVIDGAEVIIPNDASNGSRALLLLEKNGLIKLKDPTDIMATEKDIVENPKNLKFVPMDAQNIPRAFEDAGLGIINSNFAIPAGLDPYKDSLAIEDKDSPYANLVAVKKGDAEKEKFQKFLKVLHSEENKKFIEEKYKGAVVPAFK